jgi:hypothetical protein
MFAELHTALPVNDTIRVPNLDTLPSKHYGCRCLTTEANMSDEIKNVFVSHVHADDGVIPDLKALAAQQGLDLRDSSITEDRPNHASDPDYIKHKILAPHIQWASTLVVYISPETKDSEYVNWEIEYAHKNGKRIVGVWGAGVSTCEIPHALARYGHALVCWQGEDVVAAITGKLDRWQDHRGVDLGAGPVKYARA